MIFSEDDYEVNLELKTKECSVCGKLFNPTGRNPNKMKYCPRTHYSFCEICGSRFIIERSSFQNGSVKTTCSRKCVAAKTMQTVAQKYGVEGVTNISQIKEVNEKIRASLSENSEQRNAKARKTMIERYGAATPMQSEELKAKIQATNLAKYGHSNPAKNAEVRRKISDKLKSDDVQSKYKITSLEHYGVEYPAQSEEVQYMMRKTCLEHYGVEYSHQIKEISEKAAQTCLERYGVPAAFLKPEAQKKARETILQNVDNKFTRVSKLNRSFADKLKLAGLASEFEFYLGGKWYDFHILETNIVVELNPSYTHSEVPSHWMKEGLDPDYHKMKTDVAKLNDYRCLHVFDWDNWYKVISILKPRKSLYARKCEIREIDKDLAKQFLDDFHLQGSTYGVQVALGLYHNYQLVEVMTFGKPRYNRNYQWELLRLCTLPEYNVVGGASKLFNYFVKNHHPKSILSYCDVAKFSGDVYIKLGMTLDHVSPPAKIWSKGNDYVTDNLLRQRGYDQLFNAHEGKGTSNEELMLRNHWLPVYDCGQYVFTKVFKS